MEPAFLVDGVVLKRADSPDEVTWKSELLGRLPQDGFRVASPVATLDGGWTSGGWMASRYVEGSHDRTRWAELVRAERAFHSALAGVPRPGFLDGLGHRWARAHRVAWGQATVEPVGDVGRRLNALVGLLGPASEDFQVVHSDLAGNVLFAKGLAPAILDFSPWWAPVAYAEGILMADALLWYGAEADCLSLVADRPAFPRWLARGAVFRLVALNEGIKEGHRSYLDEIERFDGLIELVSSLT